MSTASPPDSLPGPAGELPDLDELVRLLVDTPSVSGSERVIADLVEGWLRRMPHLSLHRVGEVLVARTSGDRPRRVLLAGHLDTVPVAGNLPSRIEGRRLSGCGAADMKASVAVMLHLAAGAPTAACELTVVCYDCEEVESDRNGLGRLAAARPDLLQTDLAVLMEPTRGRVEAGCQGSLKVVAELTGVRAHTARAWFGDNAVYRAGPLLTHLAGYPARSVTLDGCTYREGLQAVAIAGGVAGNVVPDRCTVTVNFRYAPDRTPEQAEAYVREVLAAAESSAAVTVADHAPAAPPGLSTPAAAGFLAAVGGEPAAKLGWTDVARFAALGIPAVNYGPGDPDLAHTAGEWVDLDAVAACRDVLAAYLSGPAGATG